MVSAVVTPSQFCPLPMYPPRGYMLATRLVDQFSESWQRTTNVTLKNRMADESK
jgi:hypothetical protein